MARYMVRGQMTVSAWTVVEADSEEEARAIATERQTAELVHQALYPDEDESWHFEGDGVPEIMEVDES